jgi:ent-kaurene oxidase
MNSTTTFTTTMASAIPIDLQLPHIVAGTRHLSYYVAIATVLCVAWLCQSKKQKQIDVPFYKAAKTKWLFGAEGLVLDSYNKVWPRDSSTVHSHTC